MDIPRLNGAIKALESGKPTFVPFSPGEISSALTIAGAPYDGAVFEMEHNPYDIKPLRDCLQYMLNRRQIATSGSIAPTVTPFVRIPPNGGENSQWIPERGRETAVLGIGWPPASSRERAEAPRPAAAYWGLADEEYSPRAATCPLNPEGEVLVVIMCEEKRAIAT